MLQEYRLLPHVSSLIQLCVFLAAYYQSEVGIDRDRSIGLRSVYQVKKLRDYVAGYKQVKICCSNLRISIEEAINVVGSPDRQIRNLAAVFGENFAFDLIYRSDVVHSTEWNVRYHYVVVAFIFIFIGYAIQFFFEIRNYVCSSSTDTNEFNIVKFYLKYPFTRPLLRF